MIDVDLFLALDAGPLPEKDITNYDHVREFIRTIPVAASYAVAESLANELTAECFKLKNVQACRVSVMKSDIFNEVEGAGIEVFRTRGSWEAKK